MCIILCSSQLQCTNPSIKYFTQPLHRIKQHISALHNRFALRVLERGAGSLDYTVYFVNGGVQAAVGYEAG